MKPKPLSLAVVDLHDGLGPELVNAFKRCAASPRQRVRKDNPLLWRYDWRAFAVRYLRRVLPNAWIYRGGRHLAIHASPPRHREAEAGACLARIIEA